MKRLLVWILLSAVFGGVLFLMGLVGAVIGFAVIVGSLFWGIHMIYDIYRRILQITAKPDKAQEAYERYIKEKEEKERLT